MKIKKYQNPSSSIQKINNNKYSYTKPLNNVFVDDEGNLLDPEVPSAKGTVQLPEVIVTTRDPRKAVPTTNGLNIPDVSLELKRRFYDHITPAGYEFPITRTVLAALNPGRVKTIEVNPRMRRGRTIYPGLIRALRDDLFAEYLQIPKEERHKVIINLENNAYNSGELEKTSLRPTNAENDKYFKFKNLSKSERDRLVRLGTPLPVGSNALSKALCTYLGEHTIGHGHDTKGDYVSYYDSWDLAPFTGKGKDQSLGIGKPVHIYDRIYLDDYYEMPKEYRGSTYIPELIVTAKKHANGGNIHYTKPLDNVIVDESGNLLDPNVPSARGTIQTPDVEIIANPMDVGRGKAARLYNDYGIASNDATSTPLTRNIHLNERGIDGAKKASAWMKDHPTLNTIGMALGSVPLAVAGYPAFMVAGEGAASALANPYVDAALTSYFGAHGLQKLANGEADWTTALEITPLGRLAKPIQALGKNAITEIQALYNNYPIRNYNIDSILKSDFYKKISEKYGKEVADNLAQQLTSQEFRNYFFGTNPRKAIKAAKKHATQMQIIKEVEDAGGLISGSGQLSKHGTVHRTGLLHDLDFNIPGNITTKTSPVLDLQGYYPAPKISKRFPYIGKKVMGSPSIGYVNVPRIRKGQYLDMFIKPEAITKDNIVDVIMAGKRMFGRPKDIADITAFKPYSAENPMIDLTTGKGQWNPTLFDYGIISPEGYPIIKQIETYPGSGVKVPAVMNYRGEIRSLSGKPVYNTAQDAAERLGNVKTPTVTAENAASEMPNIVRTVQDNGKIRLSLPSHSETNPRQFVLEPQGDNKFYVHMRTWDGDHVPANLTNEEKQQLFDALYNELPEGAEILFPKSGLGYYGTRGTVAGLQRLARDTRFTPGTKGILQYLDKDGKTIKTYEGTSFIKTPRILYKKKQGGKLNKLQFLKYIKYEN